MSSLEVTESLQQDIKEQKQSIRANQSKKSGKGRAGRVLFPSDYLSKEEKKVYRQAGEVKVYSMFDTIIKIDEFKKLPPEQQVRYMVEYRKRFKGTEIAKGLGIKDATYYALASSLGVAKKYAKPQPKKKATPPAEVLTSTPPAAIVHEAAFKPEGILYGFRGTKTAQDIIAKLSKLELLLDGEESLFEIEIKIKEVV